MQLEDLFNIQINKLKIKTKHNQSINKMEYEVSVNKIAL